jgi:hypothetical protein
VSLCQSPAKAGADFLADGIQASVCELDDMKTIHNDRDMWQHIIDGLFVRLPHIHTGAGDSCSDRWGQALQIVFHGCFIAGSQQVNDASSLDICQHASGLAQQIHLIDTQDRHRGLKRLICEMGCGLSEKRADRPLRNTHILGNAGKRPAQRLMVNVVDQALCQKMVFIDIWKWFKKGSLTGLTAIPEPLDHNANLLCSDGLVHHQLALHLVPVKQSTATKGTTQRRSNQLRLNRKIALLLIHCENAIVRQPQEVQRKAMLPLQSITR